MDIKKIEELVGRYWDGDTSLMEEKELRSFFASTGELPLELERWREWFAGEKPAEAECSNEELDRIVLQYAAATKRRVMHSRLLRVVMPAAAAAAIALAIYFPARNTSLQENTLSAADLENYEMVKELLQFTAGKLDKAENVLETGIEKLNIISEYVNIK